MAGSEKIGTLVYDIEIDTAGLLDGQRRLQEQLRSLNGNLGGLNATINRTEQATRSAGTAMSSLSSMAKGLAAAITVHQITEYANAWVDVTNKLANSVRANEQVADVTQRVFDISQQTRSGLSATAALYGRLERATRTAGTSTADLVKLTTTINKGLAVSGATTEEASSTMIQLSQALASGVLRGEEFNSISENGSRLAVALASSLGVTIGQLRNMAAQGKLTTEVVVNGLLKQSDAIGKEFANTTLTMGQSFTVATNNITKFVGESSSANTTLSVFNKGVITVSENLDTVSQVIGAAALVFGGRFVGSLGASIAAQASQVRASISQAIATRSRAKEELAAAIVTQRKSDADKEAALSALNLATAEYNVAKGSAAEATALANVTRLRTAYVEAGIASAQTNNLVAESQARVAATGLTFSNSLKAISKATSPLGGPLGVIAIVATGWYLYAQNQEQARQANIDFASTLPDVISKLKEMNQVQLEGSLADTYKSIGAQRDKISELSESYSEATAIVNEFSLQLQGLKSSGAPIEVVAAAQKRLSDAISTQAQAARDLDSAGSRLNTTLADQAKIQDQLNQKARDSEAAFKVLEGSLKERIPNASSAAIAAMVSTMQVLDQLKSKASNSSQPAEPELTSKAKQLIQNAERRLALSKLEGEARAKLQAQYDAEDAGIDKGSKLIGVLESQYAETERNTTAKKENSRESKANASAQESIAQKLANLKQQSELAADSTTELSRAQAILVAQQSLGKGATQAQIQQAGEYAAKKWDTANAIRAQAAAEKLIPEVKENTSYQQDLKDLQAALAGKTISQEQFNQASERMAEQRQANLAKINAQAVNNPIGEARAEIDPVQQVVNQNNQKLELMKQYQAQEQAVLDQSYKSGQLNYQQYIAAKQQTDTQYLALRTAQETQFQQEQTAAQWQLLSQQGLGWQTLTSAIDSFSGNASNALTGLITGSMSGEDAMRSLGSTILNSVVNSLVQAAIQAAIVKPLLAAFGLSAESSLGSSTAAASESYAAWAPAAIAASIATLGTAAGTGFAAYAGATLAGSALGKRKNGGPVSAGNMYQVGEDGRPEIYQASNGSQYMIPGDNGKVISNKDLQSGSGVSVVINFNDQTSGGSHSFSATADQSGQVVTVDAFLTDLDNGGAMSMGISNRFGLSRKATGSL